MRLFKRRCSDPNPQLVSLSPLTDSVETPEIIITESISKVPQRPPSPSITKSS